MERADEVRRRRRWLSAMLGTLLATASPRAAEPQAPAAIATTRAERLEAERDDRASASTPPRRTVVERALYWYDNQDVLARVLGGWYGFHGAGGSFPAGAGTGLGIGYTAGSATGLWIDVVAARSTRGYARGSATLSARRISGAPVDLAVRSQLYEFPQQDFFGLGMSSNVDARSNYLLSNAEAGVDLTWRPATTVAVNAGVTYLSPRTGAGTDSRMPATDQAFDPATLPGYGTAADFVRTEIAVVADARDNPRHPHAGGRYGLRVADYRNLDRGGFRRADLDLQHYVPIPTRYRTLALRATATFTDDRHGTDVPFYFQPTLGGASTLRGFREFRFQDDNNVAVSAEYRWEAWWALDGALFVDAGTVAASGRRLSIRDAAVSYGVGLRLHSNNAFIARLDLAFSREGFIPLLRFDHVF